MNFDKGITTEIIYI